MSKCRPYKSFQTSGAKLTVSLQVILYQIAPAVYAASASFAENALIRSEKKMQHESRQNMHTDTPRNSGRCLLDRSCHD